MQKLNLKSFETVFDTLTYEDQLTFIESKKDIIIEGLYGLYTDDTELTNIFYGKSADDIKLRLSKNKEFRSSCIVIMHVFGQSLKGIIDEVNDLGKKVGRSVTYKEYIRICNEYDPYEDMIVEIDELIAIYKKSMNINLNIETLISSPDNDAAKDIYTDREWYLYLVTLDIRPLKKEYLNI
jgi:hypothetical protein